MSEATATFLEAVRMRRAEIRELRQTLDLEDGELVIAEKVAERLEPTMRAASETGSAITDAALAASAPKTQVELVRITLRTAEKPWFESSAALHDEIQRIHGIDIKSGSLLPLLTNLKNEGVIQRDGSRIALTERLKPPVPVSIARRPVFAGVGPSALGIAPHKETNT